MSLTNNPKTDYNSSKNQEIKSKFVNREVYACISDMAEYLFSWGDDRYASWDEWENLQYESCPECGDDNIEEVDIEEAVEAVSTDSNNGIYLCPLCGCEYKDEDLDGDAMGFAEVCCLKLKDKIYKCIYGDYFLGSDVETQISDIYEYWLVSGFLGNKLKNYRQPVLERWGAWIWGRRTTGQSILLDNVISKICEDMGILEGQAYEWDAI